VLAGSLSYPFALRAEDANSTQAKTPQSPEASRFHYALSGADNATLFWIQGPFDFKRYRSFYLKSPTYHFVLDIPSQSAGCSGSERIPVDTDQLRSVHAACHLDKVRFVFYLGEQMECLVNVENEGLRVSIAKSGSVVSLRSSESLTDKEIQPVAVEDISKEREAASESPRGGEAAYQSDASTKPGVSCDFFKSDLTDFFSLLSQVAQKPIELSPDVRGKITTRLDNVPWDQALDTVVSLYKLQVARKGDGLYISRSGKK
jgi:hypothetical protein